MATPDRRELDAIARVVASEDGAKLLAHLRESLQQNTDALVNGHADATTRDTQIGRCQMLRAIVRLLETAREDARAFQSL